MDATKGIMQWSESFVVLNGQVVCWECKSAQPLSSADEKFRHAPGCGKNVEGIQYPWNELHDTLDASRG